VVLTSIWPPYVDPKLPGHGLAVSIVTEAVRRAGYEPRIESLDWERNLENARSGEHGVIAAAYQSAERKRDFVFTDAYLTNEIRFLKRRGTDIEFNSLEDLDGLRIGVVYEYVYEPAFDQAGNFVRAPETHIVPNIVE
jgi:polar amino acid transport system substrate-binding protein